MIFGHIGRGHEDNRLAQQAKFGDTAGTGARDDQIGGRISVGHIRDKVRYLQVVGTFTARKFGLDGRTIIIARLPDELHLLLLADERQVAQNRIVQTACAERAAYNQHRSLSGSQTKLLDGFLFRAINVEQLFAHRIAGEDDFVSRKEALHTVVGYAYA